MKRILCAQLTHWSIDRLRRRRTECRRKPLVIVRTVASRKEVTAVSSEAAAAGIHAGMTLTQARALRADVLHDDENPLGDRATLEALGRWMMRFTPLVQPVGPSEDGAAALLLDVTGCQRLFGGEHHLLGRAAEALRRLRLQARLAVAPTVGAAWAMAAVQNPHPPAGGGRNTPAAHIQSPIVHPPLETALAPLPVQTLRIEPAAVRMLHHLGLETIGQVMRLPRSQLPARFGDQLLRRIDQALGKVAEPLVPLVFRAPIEAAMEFDGVIHSLETIQLVLRRLLEQVVAELHRRGCGARVLEVLLLRPHEKPIRREVRLSLPSRNPRSLFNLLDCVLEKNAAAQQRQAGTAEPPLGRSSFSGVRLAVTQSERLSEEQILLMEQEEHDGRMELGRLTERLRIRLGEAAVVKPSLIDSHLPEWAWREVEGSGFGTLNPSTRPLYLLPRPVEVGVIVSPCDAREGRPVSFSRGRRVHRLVHAVGPERLAGLWWEGHNKTRDYFDVEDEAGRRFWIFRVMENGRWFLHGQFA